MPVWKRSSSLKGLVGGFAVVTAAVACSLGDFDSLGAGPDQNVGGSAGAGGSSGGNGGTAGDGGTGGSGDAGTAGVGGSGGPSGENLIDNGDFESGASAWTPIGACSSNVVQDDRPRPDSTKCLLTTNRTEVWNGPSLNLLGRTEPGHRYRISVWVRAEDIPDGGSMPIGITQKRLCASTDGAGTFTPLTAATALGDWSELTVTFVAPECDDLQESVVYVEQAPIGDSFCIDDTSLVALD